MNFSRRRLLQGSAAFAGALALPRLAAAQDVLKIGQAAKVVYLRNGERRETMLTPAARK